MSFPFLAQRVFNRPLAIQPDKAEIIMAALAQRLGIGALRRENGKVLAFDDDAEAVIIIDGEEAPEPRKGYEVVAGCAIIPIYGTLVQKLGGLTPYSGMTGYNGIRANFLTALEDKTARGIVFDVDSCGGEVAGCFDLADLIYEARAVKPSAAILTESAYSAAYALASATSWIAVPRTGGTGSIGVIALHVDMSRMLDQAGVTVTLLQYGQRKGDGNEFSPLSKEAGARFMRDITAMGDLFTSLVARNRGLDVAAVRAQEATTYLGADGVAAGLADDVMAPDDAFRAFVADLT